MHISYTIGFIIYKILFKRRIPSKMFYTLLKLPYTYITYDWFYYFQNSSNKQIYYYGILYCYIIYDWFYYSQNLM